MGPCTWYVNLIENGQHDCDLFRAIGILATRYPTVQHMRIDRHIVQEYIIDCLPRQEALLLRSNSPIDDVMKQLLHKLDFLYTQIEILTYQPVCHCVL
jgi:hypothetical protein